MKVSKELEIGRAGEYFAVFSLISQGYSAFLTDQGLPYDIIVDVEGLILRGQVKTTIGINDYGKSRSVYRFGLRRAKKACRVAYVSECDFYAFVSVSDKKIGFMLTKDMESNINKGKIKQMMEFGSKHVDPKHKSRVDGKPRSSARKLIEDYQSFRELLKGVSNEER